MAFLQSDAHIIVSYHYVRPKDPNLSALHPCMPEEFERQVGFLSSHYRVASIGEVHEAAREGSSERLCALTFDDGTKDHFQYVLPLLERYHLPATFFFIGYPFEGKVPYTHALHYLLSRASADSLIDAFNRFLSEQYPQLRKKLFIPKNRRLGTVKRLDFGEHFLADNFKGAVTSAPRVVRDVFMASLFARQSFSEKEFCKTMFMSENEARHLCERGFSVASHTYSHSALDTLTDEEVVDEIRTGMDVFKRVFGRASELFSYPYGRDSESSHATLRKERVRYAVTVERRGVTARDSALLIPRYDTNDIRDRIC